MIRTITALFKLVEDPKILMKNRVTAAGEILERDCPEKFRLDAIDFLEWVMEQDDFTAELKLRAARTLRKAELKARCQPMYLISARLKPISLAAE